MNTVGWLVRSIRANSSSSSISGLKMTPSPSTRLNPSSTVRSASRPAEVECSRIVCPRSCATSMNCWARFEK